MELISLGDLRSSELKSDDEFMRIFGVDIPLTNGDFLLTWLQLLLEEEEEEAVECILGVFSI